MMRTWLVGAFVAVAGVVGVARSIHDDFGAWSDWSRKVPIAGATEPVRRQIEGRADLLATLLTQRAECRDRAQLLREHLVSANSPLLLDARRALDEERTVADTIDRKLRRLIVERKTAVRDAGVMALLTVMTLLTTGLIAAWISHSKALASALPPPGVRGAVLGAVLFAANTLQELATSVYVDDKDAFGFASWAVSPWSWAWVRVMALGLCLAFGSVLASAWNAAAPKRTPVPDIGNEDGGFGIVQYVSAWRWWVLLGASAALAITLGEILAIAYGQDRFNPWYLLTPTVGLIATAGPVVRAALRIQELRDTCRKARWLGAIRTPGVPLPDDPTDAFWEVPFKVPTYVLVAASAAWLALERTGVAGAILRSVGAGGP